MHRDDGLKRADQDTRGGGWCGVKSLEMLVIIQFHNC